MSLVAGRLVPISPNHIWLISHCSTLRVSRSQVNNFDWVTASWLFVFPCYCFDVYREVVSSRGD